MSDFESDFIKLLSKFENSKELITATDVNKKYIGREEDAQYRRNLLACAVSKKLAYDNGKYSTDSKYGIYFNAAGDLKKCSFFDPTVLKNQLMGDMPPMECLKWDLSAHEHAIWSMLKNEWLEVYKAFCLYQNGEKVIDQSLHFRGDEKNGEHRIVQIKMYIAMYEAIKIGWDDPALDKRFLKDKALDYNTFFVKTLYNQSFHEFMDKIEPPEKNIQPRSFYSNNLELRKHHNIGIYHPDQYDKKEGCEDEKKGMEKAIKFLRKGEEIQDVEREKRTPKLTHILNCLEQSTNPHVVRAAKKWRLTVLDYGDLTIKFYRPVRKDEK